MKKYLSLLIVLLFALTTGFSVLTATEKKPTKHKHQDKNCCCDAKCDKKEGANRADAKKDEAKKNSEQK